MTQSIKLQTSAVDPQAGSTDWLLEQARAAEREGNGSAARRNYEAALRSLDPASPAMLFASISRWIGRSYLVDGDLDAAIDCAETSLAVAEAHEEHSAAAEALILMAEVHHRQGCRTEPLRMLTVARNFATRATDGVLLATVDRHLGLLSLTRGDAVDAARHLQSSISAFDALGMEEESASATNALGEAFTALRRWAEADQAFSEVAESTARRGDRTLDLRLGVNRTVLAIARGEYDKAKSICDVAIQAARQRKDTGVLGELHKLYGIICRDTAQLSSSEAHFARAREIASSRRDARMAADIAQEEADLFALQGRSQETLRSLNRAYYLVSASAHSQEAWCAPARLSALQARLVEIVRRWAESIESADHYTEGHCVRVANYACALARSVGLDEGTLFWFRLGAMLHDLGKIVVPADLLNKVGELTAAERSLVERHPDAGVALLNEIEFPWDIRPMVRHHHEQWEGGGYPQRLAGQEIPMAARILCIADVYDALTSQRTYREGFTPERALEIMTSSMASYFDPMLLELWREACESGAIETLASTADPGAAMDADGASADEEPTRRVLVIARNFSDASMLREAAAVEPGGAVTVVHVARLTDATQRLCSEGFDAIVLGLPLQDGQEIHAVASVQEHAPEVPMLVLAGVIDNEFARRAIRSGVQDFLVRREVSGPMLLRSVRFSIERNRLRAELQAKSLLDDLTGLYNRRGFFGLALQQLKMADRRKERVALIFADVNGFKQINDQLGHREGDLALVDISNLMKNTFRMTDTLGRLGGDEFVALVPNTGAGGVATLLDRLDRHIEAYNAYASRRYRLSISLGSAIYDPRTPISIDELVRLADAAMYEQKQADADRRAEAHRIA